MPIVTLPAPSGGINNRLSRNALPPNFGFDLTNWIPSNGFLIGRGPTELLNSGSAWGDDVMSINGHPDGDVIVGTSGGELWRVGAGAAAVTGLNGSDWHGNVFTSRLILCSGVDTPRIWDGSAMSTGTYTGTGLTASNLYGSLTFKGRVLYWEQGQRFFWYCAAASFQGALSKYEVSQFCRSSGTIVSMCPLTIDGGNGPDDMLAILFSSGEVIIFQGDDPGDVNAWQMVGSFQLQEIIGRRCWAQVGSSTIVATKAGAVDLARALALGPTDISASVSANLGDVLPPNCDEVYLHNDISTRILWLAYRVSDPYIINVYGMDIESRGWFQTSGIASTGTYAAGFAGGRYLLSKGAGVYYGPMREHDGTTGDAMNSSGDVTYTLAYGYLDFGAPGQIKRIKSVRINAPRVSLTDSGSFTMTFDQPEGAYAAENATYGSILDPAPRAVSTTGRNISIAVSISGRGPWTFNGVELDIDTMSGR